MPSEVNLLELKRRHLLRELELDDDRFRELEGLSRPKQLILVVRTFGELFTKSELVVRAWLLFPKSFGLADYPYPDSHRLAAVLYGKDGPLMKGAVRQVGVLWEAVKFESNGEMLK